MKLHEKVSVLKSVDWELVYRFYVFPKYGKGTYIVLYKNGLLRERPYRPECDPDVIAAIEADGDYDIPDLNPYQGLGKETCPDGTTRFVGANGRLLSEEQVVLESLRNSNRWEDPYEKLKEEAVRWIFLNHRTNES